MSTTSERLTAVMKQKDVSCRQLAELTGIAKSTVANYANGKRQIPLDKLKAMAQALNVDAAWLVGWSDEQSPCTVASHDNSSMGVIDVSDLSEDEAELVDCYRLLNDEGQRSLLNQARIHVQIKDYLKESTQRKMA